METIQKLTADARSVITEAEQAERKALEQWLTVKEFAAKVGMKEGSVRDAIREKRLAKQFRVVRITDGKRAAIRIVMPQEAA